MVDEGSYGVRQSGQMVRTRRCASTVSYTHLDVYKRQVLDVDVLLTVLPYSGAHGTFAETPFK